jgi:hypothetical protein
MTAFMLLIFIIVLYFIPAIVAKAQERRQFVAIFMLNLLLGWTVLGWVGALIWALIEDRPAPPASVSA